MKTTERLLVHYKEAITHNSFYYFWYEGNPATFIQSIQIAKDLNVECKFNDFTEIEDLKEYDGYCFHIDNIKINLPTNEDVFAVIIEIDDFHKKGEK